MIRITGFFAGKRDKLPGLSQIVDFRPDDAILADEMPTAAEVRRHAIACGYAVPEGRFEPIYEYVRHAHEHRIKPRGGIY